MRAPLPLLCRRQRVTAAFMNQSKLRRSRFYSAFYRLRFQTSLAVRIYDFCGRSSSGGVETEVEPEAEPGTEEEGAEEEESLLP